LLVLLHRTPGLYLRPGFYLRIYAFGWGYFRDLCFLLGDLAEHGVTRKTRPVKQKSNTQNTYTDKFHRTTITTTTATTTRTFCISAAHIWNSLPTNIHEAHSILTFSQPFPPPSDLPANVPWLFLTYWRYINHLLTYWLSHYHYYYYHYQDYLTHWYYYVVYCFQSVLIYLVFHSCCVFGQVPKMEALWITAACFPHTGRSSCYPHWPCKHTAEHCSSDIPAVMCQRQWADQVTGRPNMSALIVSWTWRTAESHLVG